MRPLEPDTSDLTIVDIDDCLFHTAARVAVVDDASGRVLTKLSSSQYTRYRLEEGERFDYTEFSEAKIFAEFSSPVEKMMRMSKVLLEIIRNKPGCQMILLTARSDFDDRDLFLDTFKRFDFDVGLSHVYRAGNLGSRTPTHENKREVLKSLIQGHVSQGNQIRAIRVFDDGMKNLDALYETAVDLGVDSVSTYLVDRDGSASVRNQTKPDHLYSMVSEIVEAINQADPAGHDVKQEFIERFIAAGDHSQSQHNQLSPN